MPRHLLAIRLLPADDFARHNRWLKLLAAEGLG